MRRRPPAAARILTNWYKTKPEKRLWTRKAWIYDPFQQLTHLLAWRQDRKQGSMCIKTSATHALVMNMVRTGAALYALVAFVCVPRHAVLQLFRFVCDVCQILRGIYISPPPPSRALVARGRRKENKHWMTLKETSVESKKETRREAIKV
jgi:hypothetical protein